MFLWQNCLYIFHWILFFNFFSSSSSLVLFLCSQNDDDASMESTIKMGWKLWDSIFIVQLCLIRKLKEFFMIRDTDSGFGPWYKWVYVSGIWTLFFHRLLCFSTLFFLSFIRSNHVSDAHTICFILFSYENFSIFFLLNTMTQQH